MIEITVFGVAAPQGSKQGFNRGGRIILVEGGSKAGRQSHEMWRQAVASAARDYQIEHNMRPLDGPLQVSVDFIFPKGSSKPKWMIWHDRKPDLDKLVRAVLDSLSKLVIVDDSRVCVLLARKRYDASVPPQCRLEITQLDERNLS